MHPATIRILNEINLGFYRNHAAAFSATRTSAWPGFERAFAGLGERRADARVLDVGCGHGRLARHLAESEPPASYLGLDASEALLAQAREDAPAFARFEHAELIEGSLDAALDGRSFDAIAALGFLHHVPGRETRARLLRACAGALSPGGLLAVTVWRFGEARRFAKNTVSLDRVNAELGLTLEASELEPGDAFLRFGDMRGALRYCHFLDEAEREAAFGALPLERADRYLSDGRGGSLNDYWILGRPE